MIKLPVTWTKENYLVFLSELLELEDTSYKEFNSKLITTSYEAIGIRIPKLRDIAKKIAKSSPIAFLEVVGSNYYEEIMIEGFVIGQLKELDMTIYYFDKFLLKIDNWAVCDCVVSSMKIIKNNKELFFKKVKSYLKNKDEYIVRVGYIILLDYYIDSDYIDKIFKLCNSNKKDLYYVNMAIAWLISVCFVKEKTKTIKFLENNKLTKFTHNKAISKIRESYRVTANDKLFVNTLKK